MKNSFLIIYVLFLIPIFTFSQQGVISSRLDKVSDAFNFEKGSELKIAEELAFVNSSSNLICLKNGHTNPQFGNAEDNHIKHQMSTFAEDSSLRKEVCLNGTWELKVDGENDFVKVQVPGSYAGEDQLWGKEHWNVWDYPRDWYNKAATYRRTLEIPEIPEGQRVLIHFNGVRHVVQVEVNGKEVGTWSDSYIPFAFDITDQVRVGTNELRVNVAEDLTCGLFEDYNEKRRGIYQDVFLKFVPEIRVTPDIYVQTLVTKKQLILEVPIINAGNKIQRVNLQFTITDAKGNKVKQWIQDEQLTIAPGEVQTFKTSQPWENPHLWSVDDPYLHHITTELVNEKREVLDRYRLRFGFREITWGKQHLYLNGQEIFLRGDGGHPQGELQGTKAYSEAWIRQLKEQGVDMMRLHDFPRNVEMYEAADEMGFLFLSEAAHHFRLPPKEIAMAHVERMVKRLRNHPSILMWSVANELHWRKFEEPDYLIELCNRLDSSRPAFNSDFSAWSLHGDVISHHYDAKNIWSDWEKYGPDKVMIWDEIGNVWQQDRPLKVGPAGFEISSQDVATGTWRDGWQELRNDIEFFADGKEINGRFYRVNAYVPWELCYSFYRFQPFNNFQRMDLKYGTIEGVKGIKPKYINPCATTINIWDPTLPENQPNPALYCFKEYLARVRFPDDPKENTFFSGESIDRKGRLFYEDYRPADRVEFRVETPEGKLLNSEDRTILLKAGEYVADFKSEWKIPEVDTLMPIRLVRQFSYEGEPGYRKVDEAKIFPTFKSLDLVARKVAVVGKSLQNLLGGAGVPVSEARLIIAEKFEEAWKMRVSEGSRVLLLAKDGKVAGKQLSHLSIVLSGKNISFHGPQKNYKLSDELTLSFGTSDQEQAILTDRSFNLESPVPGTWVTIDLDGTIDFTEKGLVLLNYGLWKHPGKEGYDKQFEEAGGASFYKKTVRIMLSDASGRWFVCDEREKQELTRDFPSAFNGAVEFDCSRLSWQLVRLESGSVIPEDVAVSPDLSQVSAVGLVLDESNSGSALQIKGFDLSGGAQPTAYVQPGSVQHRLLAGLGQEDFSFWRGGSSNRSLSIPERCNVRRILFGNKDGNGSALHETFIGCGVVLESALNIGILQEPVAGFFLNRMVDYLDQYQPAETHGKLSVIGGNNLASWLEALGADLSRAQTRLLPSDIAAVDARDLKALTGAKKALIAHLEKGGTVIFSEVTPETVETIREICGKPLRLTEPYFGQRYKCIKAPVSWARVGTPHQWVDYYDGILVPYPFEPNFSPLLSGIANLDLDWKQQIMFKYGIEIEGMNPVSANVEHQVLISNWHIGSEGTDHLYGEQLNGVRDLRQNSWFVNRDPVVMEVAARGGRVIISQLDLAAGGRKASRVMQTLLTNLGTSFSGAMPAPTDKIYDSAGRKDQLKRFAVYDRQVDPVKRQFYGVPDSIPSYMKGTRIQASLNDVDLPVLGFFGDPMTLKLAKPLEQALLDVVRIDEPVRLMQSSLAAKNLRDQIGDKKYARVVFSIGERDLDDTGLMADFEHNLNIVWKILAEHSQKIYWMPIPSEYGKDEQRAKRASELNRIADQFFEGKDVYKIPFVYADTEKLPLGYFSGHSEQFTPAEAEALAKRLAEAVISFGAQ